MFNYGQYWQADELSDIDLLVKLEPGDVLFKLPAHKLVLSHSPFFKAKILRWQSDTQDRPTLTVTLQNDSQLPAALAVLEALYGGRPVQDLLSSLSLQQQMHAAVLADMWQLESVSSAAMQTLQAALAHAKSPGLLQSAMQAVFSLPSLPACLMPVIRNIIAHACSSKLMYQHADTNSGRMHRSSLQQLLLYMLGDLEAVWHSSTLTEMLLELPAAAMKLLLASDDLMVASEDTVLYTAQAWINHSFRVTSLKKEIAELIRCPQLSNFWLSASVLAQNAGDQLLQPLSSRVTQLQLLRLTVPDYPCYGYSIRQAIPDAPVSWSCGPRRHSEVCSVSCSWQVDVSTIRQAALASVQQRALQILPCDTTTPPFAGLAWSMELLCKSVEAEGVRGSRIDVHVKSVNAPSGTFYHGSFALAVEGWQQAAGKVLVHMTDGGFTFTDPFGVGLLLEGWDEVCWAAKGLPKPSGTTGLMTLTLTVSE